MKTYQLLGIDTAIHLLRPGAKWEWTDGGTATSGTNGGSGIVILRVNYT